MNVLETPDEATRRSVRCRLLGHDYCGCVVAVLNPDAVIDFEDETAAVIRHDARTLPLEDESMDLIVTSPPYFALRSYRDDGEHFDAQIGSEDTPDQFLDALDECMVEWGRVLKPSGSVWINLGDKYMARQMGYGQTEGSWAKVHAHTGDTRSAGEVIHDERAESGAMIDVSGIPRKSLMGLPWRFAIRQIDNNWILRAEVIWDKPNSLPESVTDRVRRSHEQWFHFVKEPRYFSGVDEIREEYAPVQGGPSTHTGRPGQRGDLASGAPDGSPFPNDGRGSNPLGRLPGSVWRIPSEPLQISDDTRQALDLPDHFAAFPQEFPRRIILGWSPTGGTVLDPMGGTGTVAGVARMLGRYGISNDLSADYNKLAIWRITQSGHFTKTEQRTWADRQGSLI